MAPAEFYFDPSDTKAFLTSPSGSSYQLLIDEVGSLLISLNGSGVTTSDPRLAPFHIVNITKNPGAGEFSSIASGVASISGAGATNPFIVSIGPGVYAEPLINLPSGVAIVGQDVNSCIIVPIGNNGIFSLSNNSHLNGVTISSVPSGQVGVVVDNPTGFVSLHRVAFNDCYNALSSTVYSGVAAQALFLEYVQASSDSADGASFQFKSLDGSVLFVNAQNTSAFTNNTSNPPLGMLASGAGINVVLKACEFGGLDQTGKALEVLDGASVTANDVNFILWASGVHIPQYGAAPNLSLGATSFFNNIENINIEHSGTTGFLDSFSEYNKTSINSESDFFIANKDQRIVTVAIKGGDFNSVKDAIDSISDSSVSNTYVVSVGPGIFNEDTITMKPYVSIIGENYNNTVIQASSSGNSIIVGSDFSTLQNLALNGATQSGTFAIFHSPTSGTTNTSFIVDSVKFGNNYGHVKCFSSGNIAAVLIQNSLYGSTGQFYQGFVSENIASSGAARIQLRNCSSIGMSAPSPTEFALGTGFGADITLSTIIVRNSNPVASGNNCVVLENGAKLRASSVNIRGWDQAIWIKNVGDASALSCVAMSLENNNRDLVVEHPSASGSFFGAMARTKTTIDASGITILHLDPDEAGITTFGKFFFGDTYADTIDVAGLIENTPTMGIITGGVLSSGVGLNVDISAGYGYLMSGNFPTHMLRRVEWSGQSLTLPSGTASYVFFNSTPVLTSSTSLPNTASNILFGRVVTGPDTIEIIDPTPLDAHHFSNKIDEAWRKVFGPLYSTGSVTSNLSGLYISVTNGEYYYSETKLTPSGGINIPFTAYFHSGGSFTNSVQNAVDNTQYDDGSNLAPLSGSYFTKHGLYVNGENQTEKYLLVYGQAQYSGLALANDAPTATPPTYFIDSIAHIADIIVQQGSGAIIQINDTRPFPSSRATSSAGVTVHGDLLGLSADDHTQYLLANGSRAMSGSLDMGGNNVTNVNLVDGVDVSAHASRHLPNGADAITTAAPTTSLSANSTNSVGVQNTLSRSDHSHAIDFTVTIPSSTITSLNSSTISGTTVNSDTVNSKLVNSNVVSGTTISGNAITTNSILSNTSNSSTYSGTTINNNTLNGKVATFITNVNSPIVSGTTVNSDTVNSKIVSGTTINNDTLNGKVATFTTNVASPVVSGTTINNDTLNGKVATLTTSISSPVVSGTTINNDTLNGKAAIFTTNVNSPIVSGTTINNDTLNGKTSIFTVSVNSPVVSGTTINNDTLNGKVALFSNNVNASVLSGTTISGNTLSLNGALNSNDGANFATTVNANVISGTTVSGNNMFIGGRKAISQRAIVFIMDGGGSVVPSGNQGHIEVPFAATFNSWALDADVSGDMVIDVRRTTHAAWSGYAAVGTAQSITSTDKPNINSGFKGENTTITLWSGLSANDILTFHAAPGPSGVTRASLTIFVTPA